MAKRLDSPYIPGGHPGTWQKKKTQPTDDFLVGGYMAGLHGFDELLVGRREGKRFLFMASVKAGFVPRVKRQVYGVIRDLEQQECPFTNLPEKRTAQI